MSEPKIGELKVWWIPQIPMDAFTVPVRNLREAKLLLETLAEYDAFQLANNIKPDYANAGGLQEWDGNDWLDWYSADGKDIDDLTDEQIARLDRNN